LFSTHSERPALIREFSLAPLPLPNTGTVQSVRFWPRLSLAAVR
jgi:hypothetical protein